MSANSITILLVEDNPGDTRLIQEYLMEDEAVKFLLLHSATLEKALDELSKRKVELILLDLGLPDSQDLDTFRKIHACAPWLPIVVLSGLNDTTLALSAVQAGAQDFLIKDEINPDNLRRTLRYAQERQQVEEALRRKNQFLMALQETTFELVSQLNTDILLENIIRRSAQLLGTTSGFLDLLEPMSNQLVPRIGLGVLADSLIFPVVSGRGVAGIVWQTGQPLLVPDYDSWSQKIEDFPEKAISSIIGVPLSSNHQVLGVLGLAYEYGNQQTFAEDALEFLTQFARLAAIAIENASLYSSSQRELAERKQTEEKLQHSNLELARLYRISGSLIASEPFDLYGLAQAIVETVIKEFDITNCCLHISKPNSTELVRLAYAGKFPQPSPDIQLRLDGPGLIPLCMRTAQLVNEADVYSRTDFVEGADGTRSELVVPLLIHEHVIGALNLESDRVNNFNNADEKVLRAFAHQAAVVLENTRLVAETSMQVLRLKSLRRIDETINASLDFGVTTNILLEQILSLLNVDAADILLYNPFTKNLKYVNGSGFITNALQHTDLKLGQGLAGKAAYKRQIVHVSELDSHDEFFKVAPLMPEEHFVEYYGVPLISKGTVKGLLEIFHRSPLKTDETWLDFLETLAGQAAIAIDNIQMFEDLQHSNNELTLAYDATIEGWSRTLDLRDKETEGHSQRVAEITLRLAKASGIQGEELVNIRRGALLHDIGKMGISDSILLKAGPLNDDEWTIMRRHPMSAFELLSPIAFLQPALDIPYCHHEKWDGSGYPRGLKGEQIPLSARLFAIADIWDALTSDRPYRAAWTESRASEFVREQAGKHLDPRVVELFFSHYLNEAGLKLRPTILIVDDEENVTRSLARSLKDDFTVLTAASGEEALRIVERFDPAVVLTDQRMPGMSGVELLEKISILRPRTSGILISGYSDIVALTAAVNLANVRGFLPKPWDTETLRSKLDQAVNQHREITRRGASVF